MGAGCCRERRAAACGGQRDYRGVEERLWRARRGCMYSVGGLLGQARRMKRQVRPKGPPPSPRAPSPFRARQPLPRHSQGGGRVGRHCCCCCCCSGCCCGGRATAKAHGRHGNRNGNGGGGGGVAAQPSSFATARHPFSAMRWPWTSAFSLHPGPSASASSLVYSISV